MLKKLILLLLTLPIITGASGVQVNPTVVDREAYLRDNFTFQASVKNEGDSTYRFYPVVVNQSAKDGENFSATEGLSDWISVDRGRMQVKPDEEKIIDVSFDIPGGAEPGLYYGKLFFSKGSSRGGAADYAKKNKTPHLFIRLLVKENIVENAQLVDFSAEKRINFIGNPELKTEIKSIGNREITPQGEVLVYKERTGREVAALEINEDGQAIEPEQATSFKNKMENSGFGSYRAELRATYGEESVRDIQSTTHFKIIPLPLAIGFILVILTLTTALIVLVKKIADQNI